MHSSASREPGGSFWRWVGAAACVLVCVVAWVSMSEVIQGVEHMYQKPFFIRIVTTGGYVFGILPWYIMSCTDKRRHATGSPQAAAMVPPTPAPLGQRWQRLFRPGLLLGVAAFIYGYSWYLSLDHTSAAINNSIYQSQCVFVYLFSVAFLHDQLRVQKIIAILIALCGVVIISVDTGARRHNGRRETTWYGIALCLMSTVFYAGFEVAIGYLAEREYGREDRQRVQDSLLLLAIFGVVAMLIGFPMLFILHVTGIEVFLWPSPEEWTGVLATMVLDWSYNAAFLIGIALSSPLFVSLGSLLIIPASFATDVFLGHDAIRRYSVLGSVVVIVGLVLMQLDVDIQDELAPEQPSVYTRRNKEKAPLLPTDDIPIKPAGRAYQGRV